MKEFFGFKDKYPNKGVLIDIYPSKRITEYVAFDITFVIDGKIDYFQSTETSEMLDFFKLVDDDGTFQTDGCTRNTFEEANNYAHVDQKIKAYVEHLMKENPSRNLI